MKWILRIFVALFFGFVFFGAIQQYFRLDHLISVVLSIALSALTSFVTTTDAVKKFYDARKAPYELRDLQRKEEAAERANSVIKTASDDDLKKYARSEVERTLQERFRNAGSDALKPKRFVIDSREEKI